MSPLTEIKCATNPIFRAVIASFFDIGPCFGILAPVKTRYPLSNIGDHIAGSCLKVIEATKVFKFTVDQVLVFYLIAGSF